MRKVLKSLVSLLVIATMLLSMASVSFASTVETTGAISLSTDGIEEVTFGDETFTGVVVTAKASVQDEYFAGWGEGAVAYNASLFEFVGAEKLQFIDAFGNSCEWTLFDVFDEPDNSKVVVGIGVGDNVGIGNEDFSAGVPYGEAEMVKLYFRVKDGADTAGKTANFEAEGSLIYWDWENNLNNEMDAFGFMKNMNYKDAPVEFAPAEYTITYIADGATIGTQTYEAGQTISALAAPAKDGYTFKGWDGFPADGLMPAENITVTATYEEIPVTKYTITYVIDGATIGTQTYEAGQAITALAAPAKDGYKFDGWANIPATMPAENITVTGSYSEIPAGTKEFDAGINGDNVKLFLDLETGAATLTGSGAMADYNKKSAVPWIEYMDQITSVTISEGVTTIGVRAFIDATAIQNITMPLSVGTIKAQAFNGATIGTVTATGTKEQFYAMSFSESSYNRPILVASWTVTDPATGNVLYSGMHGNARWLYDVANCKLDVYKSPVVTNVTAVPINDFKDKNYKNAPWYPYMATVEEIELTGISTVLSHSFRQAPNLKNVVINEGTTTLGLAAFGYNSALKTISLPYGLTNIQKKAFYVSTTNNSLESINVNMTMEEYDDVVVGSENIVFNRRLKIFTDGYTGWHSKAIYWSVNKDGVLALENRNSSVEGAYRMMADNCNYDYDVPWYVCRDQITSIEIPRYITQIGKSSFYNLDNVKEITFPSGVQKISANACRSMDSLEVITLPNTVTDIGSRAFQDSTNLKTIYYNGTEEEFNNITVSGTGNKPFTSAEVIYVQ